ncbi:MAG: isochorismatase family cysteine hydrolase [Dehalococcoidia bacterium]|nr:isochorismatase family cysteine hydrolase [Dehalococcoidia bacterium]
MADWKFIGKPTLLVLDLQHDIVGTGGKGEPMGFPKACRESGIIPRVQSLLKAFRDKKLPVVYVVAEFNPTVPEPVYGKFYEYMRAERPCATQKGTEIITEVAPLWNEPVVRKWNIGIFSNSRLDQVLKHYGAETLIFTGVATNLVVHIGAVQATDLGYNVIVPADAVTSNDKEAHEYTMSKVLPLITLISTTEEVLAKVKSY